MAGTDDSIQQHYMRGDLWEAIEAGLRELGMDSRPLTPDELAFVDQFHTRGKHSTRELAALAGLQPGQHVVDVGSGLGGPARHLAAAYGCRVTGVDLVDEFCRVANLLSARTGLADRTTFRQGSALEMPFADGTFDAAWTFQAQMNIADKARFYGEIQRVLRPGGRLVFQDLFQGTGGPVHVPVPWASEAGQSFLVTPEAARAAVEGAGFRILEWRDATADTLAWSEKVAQRRPAISPPLGIHLVLGPQTEIKQKNILRNQQEGRVAFIQALAEKAG